MTPGPMTLLAAVPDPFEPWAVEGWMSERIQAVGDVRPDRDGARPFVPVEVPSPAMGHPLGEWGDGRFRRALLALLLADWVSYDSADDRVDFGRLAFVVGRFPRGFRLWFSEVDGLGWVPVGYTGWYPIDPTTFDQLLAGAPVHADRAVVPLREVGPAPVLYLFNYSVARPFRRTAASRRLLSAYFADVEAQSPGGLAAITVSGDGSRVAARAGLAPVAELRSGTCLEHVYARRT
jgi:hypothetical protein